MRPLRLILLTVAAVILTAAPAAAAPDRTPAPGERIINGHAPSQPWPAQTSVVLTIGGQQFVCGGTLVSARWVLTAGHCATDDAGAPLAPGAFSLRVGSTRRTTGGNLVGVDQVVRQPGYTNADPPDNDLALLHLASAVPQEPLRLIATTAAEAASWNPGVEATIIGWGITNPADPNSQATTLVEAQAPMVSDATCARVWGTFFGSASMVCAGGTGTDTCGGDSGGPLMVPRAGGFALVGVTSWGSATCGATGVYARLGAPALNAWVRSKVPTVALSPAAATVATGEPVSLSATVSPGAQPSAPTSLSWDLDDDAAFDDATGATAGAAFGSPGNHVVRVQALFADGDRAVTREVVSVASPAAPPPPPPPAAAAVATVPAATTAPPAPQATPAQIQEIQTTLQPAAIGTFAVPRRVKLRTLRTTRLRVRFHCERACRISGRMTLGATTARRFGLRRGETIGRGSAARTAGGSSAMTVRLTSRAKRALRNRARFTIRLAGELTGDGATPVRRTRTIAVRR